MFMPQAPPKLTEEEKAENRRRTLNAISNFVKIVVAIRIAPYAIEYAKQYF
ncbi:uncharacterized protein VTP21DRAFT_7005 [Calcarisporiella thermophila]|uniref:uncharacterized protein n=1 Tax=Calcarisporiella thermophila TaxID=911321 RepID=UPI0037447F8A